MNNEQFRRLLVNNNSNNSTPKAGSSTSPSQNASRGGGATPALLGSRMRSSIPMTPRSVTGVDFARQLAEYRRDGQPPTKRFRSSAAPKGTKLPAGYQDRAARLRETGEEEEDKDDLEKRIKALEEMVKLGQIDRETFEKLQVELGVGGDLNSTHMVKGLDWELLRRVRAGEDVEKKEGEEEVVEDTVGDVDEEFEKLEERTGEELPSAPKEKEKKKGTMAPPPGRKSRDEILKQLKASRAAAAAAEQQAAEPALGSKFKRIGDSKVEKKRWVEQDENGRRKEILQITDAEGKTKRKVRWLDKPGETNAGGLLVPDKDAKPLGMEVPAEVAAKASAPSEDEDDDIFAGVGDDYNPLGDIESDESSSDEEDGEVGEKPARTTEAAPKETPKPSGEAPAKPRNYFSTSTTEATEEDRSNPLTKDPTLLAALKRAAALRRAEPSAEDEAGEGEEDADTETLLRRKKFLEEARRREQLDAMDMDLGFGSSRVEDDEDDEVILEERGGKKRKRGPKKKKGDKDNVSDVMRVLEGRKKD
ncbi:hypothetical protein P875_00064886 [Aspergillus parasiticus SU-1]|uniref:RED-like N-terminal domain-containing protein n=1 Tax=Aspergillus parasiticus (strain ATCC 56775 / NRRL 5862 / SRRC 143 / SU-1) TaxID=1403190 RepID=A0A0F0I7B6_ASPPU|nr:hypothetical protein P875_00064886 [Aspergillus parasiticus SU-1]